MVPMQLIKVLSAILALFKPIYNKSPAYVGMSRFSPGHDGDYFTPFPLNCFVLF